MAAADTAQVADLARGIQAGERRALARAITLVESARADHRAAARALTESLARGGAPDALRIGLTGTPGVGKSSFIERFGMELAEAGRRVAVLAVDPSSSRSGGSILGDKTRMEQLARHPNAYIRPSPSGQSLGGVARRTRETVLLVEAAGFDTVLVETVGVGQSETLVSEMTDIFLLLLAPGGGDELQGVKRGIMEIADFVVINKADGALEPLAKATRADYQGALGLLRRRAGDPDDVPAALTASAVTGAGLETIWGRIAALDAHRRASGSHTTRRAEQAVSAFERALSVGALARLSDHPSLSARLPAMRAEVAEGHRLPEDAADALLDLLFPR
ncbi:MAG: methylmalonyl Co-A mutase-associated GTPase MeaB [Pseudomonadota bacterium]